MDRSALILDIFDQRARSREARTQVELARLKYMLPRLTRQWSHLSRQGGGKGTRGGEGEKQLEQDRRVLRARVRRLEEDLEKIERTRGVQRHGRTGAPTVALTGYTNAGKSTLFNRLTAAGTLAEDRLFATLDAKLRKGSIDGARTAVFADTVGFIRKLPHHLVSSFRSTLGEITSADLVLHVIDRSHPHWQEQADVAEKVMDELGVERDRVINVYNKSDRLGRGAARGRGDRGLGAHRPGDRGAAAGDRPPAGDRRRSATAALGGGQPAAAGDGRRRCSGPGSFAPGRPGRAAKSGSSGELPLFMRGRGVLAAAAVGARPARRRADHRRLRVLGDVQGPEHRAQGVGAEDAVERGRRAGGDRRRGRRAEDEWVEVDGLDVRRRTWR